jgi:aldehyde dehydrogenase (NAD+)
LRHLIARRADEFADSVSRPAPETLVSEVLPLAEACRFLERNAESLLSPHRVEGDTPLWLRSVDLEIYRDPVGVVLIIGPANYPLFLPGVQLVQALTAGNAVLLKPGTAGLTAAALLLMSAREAGFPSGLFAVLDESPEPAQEAIAAGVDKILITGSKQTGISVLAAAAPHITPVVAELSGRDPVFVLDDADVELAARALRFGVRFNAGNTCIRPRTVFGSAEILARLSSLTDELDFVSVSSEEEALRLAAECEYALGATVFGSPRRAAAFATKVRAGVVVINDMIAPTAHPALPFGGRGSSGFGVTRGAEGLLELTTTKAIVVQRSRWLPHFEAPRAADRRLFSAFIRAFHAGAWKVRVRACADMWRALIDRRKEI